MNFKNPEGQIAHWIEVLSSYDVKGEHMPGRLHNIADGVSRIPCNHDEVSRIQCNQCCKSDRGSVNALNA